MSVCAERLRALRSALAAPAALLALCLYACAPIPDPEQPPVGISPPTTAAPAPQVLPERPAPGSPGAAPGADAAPARLALRAVGTDRALLWAGPEVRGETLAVLQRGQLLLIEEGTETAPVVWQGRSAPLVAVRSGGLGGAGARGWALASALQEVELPARGAAIGPLAEPEPRCQPRAADPGYGAEVEILRVEGEELVFEAPCLEVAEDGGPEGAQGALSRRRGTARADRFTLLRSPGSCVDRLAAIPVRSGDLAARWPTEAAACAALTVAPIALPGAPQALRVDLPGGDHPAEGFVVNGAFLPISFEGRRVFDGPDYSLWLWERGGRLKVYRIGASPPSLLEVLDRPLTGEDAGAVVVGGDGSIGGGVDCTWLPGWRQFYKCR